MRASALYVVNAVTLPPRAGGDAEGRGGSGKFVTPSRSNPLKRRGDPPLSLRDISPQKGGEFYHGLRKQNSLGAARGLTPA